MTFFETLRASPGLLMFAVCVLGLAVGSFLNVVIHRLPLMMERNWKRECRLLLALEPEPETQPLSLLKPGSRCPHCGVAIRPWHNVPLLGYLWLRGRCAACGARISIQYPLVEAAAGLLAAVCAWRFGWSPQLAAALVFSWTLLALAVIDLHTQLLPDDLTLPLLWLGLALSLFPVFADVRASLIGALAGYLSLWTLYHLFRLLTGKEGMGYGDFKLLAAAGAWLGWQALPVVVLLSSLVGAAIGIGLIALKRHDARQPISFGPFIAAAAWITLIWGGSLTRAYLGMH